MKRQKSLLLRLLTIVTITILAPSILTFLVFFRTVPERMETQAQANVGFYIDQTNSSVKNSMELAREVSFGALGDPMLQKNMLKEKAKTEEPKKDIQDLIDFVAEYKDPDNYRWFFWESWLDIDMHRAEGENSFIDAMKSQLEDMAMEAMMDLSCLGYCLGL